MLWFFFKLPPLTQTEPLSKQTVSPTATVPIPTSRATTQLPVPTPAKSTNPPPTVAPSPDPTMTGPTRGRATELTGSPTPKLISGN